MYYFIILFIGLCLIYSFKEGYINHTELPLPVEDVNCPQIHADNYKKIGNSMRTIQPFGYTKNELFDMTRFTETDIPLPTDPDFFKHI
tara:strand:- start:800 stop:1063 length:264 start_codon:yes stop_codon:yes gene_type:complete